MLVFNLAFCDADQITFEAPATLRAIDEGIEHCDDLIAAFRTSRCVVPSTHQLRWRQRQLLTKQRRHQRRQQFDPDRFGPEREEHKQPFAYLGFGAGMHQCMGQQFAFVQVHVKKCTGYLHLSFTFAVHTRFTWKSGTLRRLMVLEEAVAVPLLSCACTHLPLYLFELYGGR